MGGTTAESKCFKEENPDVEEELLLALLLRALGNF